MLDADGALWRSRVIVSIAPGGGRPRHDLARPMVISAITQNAARSRVGRISIFWSSTCHPYRRCAAHHGAAGRRVARAVIVSTPQDIALIDARRGIAMFDKVNIPLLGLIRKHVQLLCPELHHVHADLGHGGARLEPKGAAFHFWARSRSISIFARHRTTDAPIVAIEPESLHAMRYIDMPVKCGRRLPSGTASRPAPRIVIE